MGSGVVVVDDPGLHGLASLLGGLVGAGVGPLPQACLDEALGFAVGAWRIGSGTNVLDRELGEALAEGIGGAVVGHDALDGNAVAGEPVEGAAEEGDGAFFLLVRQEFGVGEPRSIVDRHMQRLPADAVMAVDRARPATGDAMADAFDATELLGVEVDEFTRPLALVAQGRQRRIEPLEVAETEPTQDRAHGRARQTEPAVKRLLTIAGVNLTVAAGLVAAIGDVHRFASPQKLVSYIGLNPRVRQSGLGLAQHGRISKHGRSHARAMLIEAAWAAAKAPGPLHAFFIRIRARRGHQVAAVAVARKLVVLCWHLLSKDMDYQWARPGLVASKLRSMQLQAGMPARKGGKRGIAYVYNVKKLRDREIDIARTAESVYERFVSHWQPRRPTAGRTGAAKEDRR